MSDERKVLSQSSLWVVKIGSALLTNDGQGLNLEGIAQWVDQISALRKKGIDVVLVSSGSVAEGMLRLGLESRPKAIHDLQAAAAVGQMGLIQAYESCFSGHDLRSAQVLLTHADFANRQRYLNARSTLRTLISMGVTPIVNENDTVITDEIRFGDNDTLGALVANLVEADTLAILTDQQGLFTADPRHNPDAELIHLASADDQSLEEIAGSGGALGRGGMLTKVRAARLAARSGASTVIASGNVDQVLLRIQQAEKVGTLLIPEDDPMAAKKRWLIGQLQAQGRLVLDAGAVEMLQQNGTSLLPVGVMSVEGDFVRGDMVVCFDENEQPVAQGLVNYSAKDAEQIIGLPSQEIEGVLGYVDDLELMHRDNLVLM